jgi:hypothetical protein
MINWTLECFLLSKKIGRIAPLERTPLQSRGNVVVHQRVGANLSSIRSIALLLLVVLLWPGCGGPVSRVKRSYQLDSAYRSIQVHEAEIEAYRSKVWSRQPPCRTLCKSAKKLCRASRDICAIANRIEEADAFTRCRRADDTCHQGQRRVTVRCRCPWLIADRNHGKLD